MKIGACPVSPVYLYLPSISFPFFHPLPPIFSVPVPLTPTHVRKRYVCVRWRRVGTHTRPAVENVAQHCRRACAGRLFGGGAARSGGRVSPVSVVRGVSVTATAVSYGSFAKWCCVWCRLIARCIGINAYYDRISTYVCRFVVAYLFRVHARAFSLSLSLARSLALFTSLTASLLPPPTQIPPPSLFRSPIFGSVEVRAGTPRSIS